GRCPTVRANQAGRVMAVYKGTQATDIIIGNQFESDVFLDFGQGQDIAIGGDSTDRFFFSVDQAKDTIDGRGGTHDLIDYSAADRGVQIDLQGGHVSSVFFVPTTITIPGSSQLGTVTTTVTMMQPQLKVVADVSNIEDANGSNFNDVSTGTSADNILIGFKGDDTLNGGGGDDTLKGGEDDDRLSGGTGHNTMDGGTGNDTFTLQFEDSTNDALIDT